MTDEHRSAFRTLDAFWLTLTVGVLGGVAAFAPLRSWDYWFHITVGRLLDRHHALPTTDIFSFTAAPETPLMVQPWIGKFWLYRLHEFGGLPTAMLARNLLALAAIAVVAMAVYRLTERNARMTAALTLMQGLAFMAASMFAGPQMFAWPLFAALLGVALLAIHDKINPWAVLVFVPVAAFWANLAPQFAMPALLALIFAAATWKKQREVFVPFAVAAAGSIGAMFVSPYGFDIVAAMPDTTGAEAWILLGAPILFSPLASDWLRADQRAVSLPVGVLLPGLVALAAVALQPWTEAHRSLPPLVFDDVRTQPPLAGFAPASTPVTAVEVVRLWGSQPRVLAEPHFSGYLLYEVQDPDNALPIVWRSPDHPPTEESAALEGELFDNPVAARGILQQYAVGAVILTGPLESLREELDRAIEWERVLESPNGTLYQRVRVERAQNPPPNSK